MAAMVVLVVVLFVLLVGAAVLFWRLYTDGVRRVDAATELVRAERARADQQRSALQRYQVSFASISGRGELGEQVLVETARALGLREGLHFRLQADLAGGGSVRPDLVLTVGGGRQVPVDAKMSLACWAEAVETDDPAERAEALRVHVRHIRARAAELAGKGYQRWADAIYGTIMFVPSDAAVAAALDTDPELLRWLLDRRVFPCGPTGFAVIASAALFAATDRAIAEDVEQVRAYAAAATRAAGGAVDAANLSSTHLQRFLAARRRELDALTQFRATVSPLAAASASPTPIAEVRQPDELAVSEQPAVAAGEYRESHKNRPSPSNVPAGSDVTVEGR
ncbi:MAG TPA: DNA recombination protein RmuC [Pseudonocardiaceae bacterium]|jgi:DNA recombination protein RmuC|nr:DNA recombination protein RmuC [Pseudonocardiaceae bacterium]